MNAMHAKKTAAEPPLVVLTGFMGTGKTDSGRALAGMLGLDFIDTDASIADEAGMPVADIFEQLGEARFREMEASLCRTLADRRGAVIATGGGTLLNADLFNLFSKRAKLVVLEASAKTLCERLRGDRHRPLLAATGGAMKSAANPDAALAARITQLLADRATVYERIGTRIDTSNLDPTETAARIAAAIAPPSESITVSLFPGDRAPDVSAATRERKTAVRGRFGDAVVDIGRGALSSLGHRLCALGVGTRAFVLIPDSLRPLFGAQVEASLRAADVRATLITIQDGDAHKTLGKTAEILDILIDAGAARDSTIVPVGGGVTGDIGGFVASVFMRGIPLVQVPTTLLAQVDSSIGGKVGVNHAAAKNLIGSFYQPHLIIIDPCTLRSLSTEEISNGMAEVVKSALIYSEAFFNDLEKHMQDAAEVHLRDTAFLEWCVTETAHIKIDIVHRDPFEKNLRRTLNLGHTLGHALEASGGYQGLKHGQAVSMGIVAAFRIAQNRGIIAPAVLDRVRALLGWCGLPTAPEHVDAEALKRSMRLDKKVKNGKLHFVLPTGVGTVTVVDDVSADEILAAIEKG